MRINTVVPSSGVNARKRAAEKHRRDTIAKQYFIGQPGSSYVWQGALAVWNPEKARYLEKMRGMKHPDRSYGPGPSRPPPRKPKCAPAEPNDPDEWAMPAMGQGGAQGGWGAWVGQPWGDTGASWGNAGAGSDSDD
ncbi:hypothetical protein FA95DRAFT_1611602 [Auriscalpium vulgare]|uniref:Uncharacterized protein n=2 Tax=Auriscalpium vulgare TaxID=40419 RepID=A0ACB8R981_9AGAM|nr:hypothetical protein FA95DRAFT_1612957 [Auriscalpium vulgare]KAI0040690.1 hypothetical protein FA95DRAFT_1611602 [Auriscalpium vulgare]